MTPEQLAKDNLPEINEAHSNAVGAGMSEPIMLVFDVADEKARELAKVALALAAKPDSKVAIMAKPYEMTWRWIIRTLGDDALAGRLVHPSSDSDLRCLVFTDGEYAEVDPLAQVESLPSAGEEPTDA